VNRSATSGETNPFRPRELGVRLNHELPAGRELVMGGRKPNVPMVL
jgi:hypothetical protein